MLNIKEGFLCRSWRITLSVAQCMFLVLEQHVAMEQHLFQGRPGVLQQD